MHFDKEKKFIASSAHYQKEGCWDKPTHRCPGSSQTGEKAHDPSTEAGLASPKARFTPVFGEKLRSGTIPVGRWSAVTPPRPQLNLEEGTRAGLLELSSVCTFERERESGLHIFPVAAQPPTTGRMNWKTAREWEITESVHLLTCWCRTAHGGQIVDVCDVTHPESPLLKDTRAQ